MKFKQRRAHPIAHTLLPKITDDPDSHEEIVNEAIKEEAGSQGLSPWPRPKPQIPSFMLI
jgi:hypothetical protein